jgi:3-oxoacyl-(acyl-carrier-protein) synthase
VANALSLKGVNTTLAPGPHAGLQCLAYAFEALRERRAKCIVAGAADEAYAQTYFNYDLMRFLNEGDEERDYRIRPFEPRRKVLGEGAAALALETFDEARARGARILAEVLGYAMPADGAPFEGQSMGVDGFVHACETALRRAGADSESVGLVVWAPQGNAQDMKVIEGVARVLGERAKTVPFVTTTFNTGYIESASILVTLGAALAGLSEGGALWPQRTGLPDIDSRPLTGRAEIVLAAATTDLGYNFAVVVKPVEA